MQRLLPAVTTLLDLAGAALVISFAVVVWWPAALLLGGVGCLAASWKATR